MILADTEKHFNSHAHVERDAEVSENSYIHMDFNSHAHVERDLAKPKTIKGVEISTHTLTWSVTDKRTEQTHY